MKTLKLILLTAFLLTMGSSSAIASEEGIGWQVDMLPWKQVNRILPKYSKFTVLDVETGKKFKVQRRAGSHHADVML